MTDLKLMAALAGLFGMAFGLFCAPVYMFVGGNFSFSYGIRWWLAGLPFDIAHGIGNLVIALVLFVPMRLLLTRLYSKMK